MLRQRVSPPVVVKYLHPLSGVPSIPVADRSSAVSKPFFAPFLEISVVWDGFP
jgi:hypothetical protein